MPAAAGTRKLEGGRAGDAGGRAGDAVDAAHLKIR